MIELWFAVLGLFIMLLFGISVFLYSVASGLNLEDSYRIDPVPKENKQSLH
jgi:hypothetical protein